MKMSKELQSNLQSISKEEIEKAYLEYYSKPIKDPILKWYHKICNDLRLATEYGENYKVLDLCIECWEMYLKYFDKKDTMECYIYYTIVGRADCTSFNLIEILKINKDLPYYIAMLDLRTGHIEDITFVKKMVEILKGIREGTIKDLTQDTKDAIKIAYKGWCQKYDFSETYERLFKENLY